MAARRRFVAGTGPARAFQAGVVVPEAGVRSRSASPRAIRCAGSRTVPAHSRALDPTPYTRRTGLDNRSPARPDPGSPHRRPARRRRRR